MAVEQLKVEVAERSGPVQDRVSLVTIPSTRHDGGEIVMGMVGGIAEVTPDHHRGLVEQRAPLFLDFIQIGEEAVEVLHDIDLDPAQFNEAVVGPGESVSVNLSATSIMGQREYLVMRIVEEGSPEPDVRLIIDSEDCEWIEPGFLHVDRHACSLLHLVEINKDHDVVLLLQKR